MNLNPLNLLTKGQTIRGLKERPGPYKLLGKSGLPNFSGPKAVAAPTVTHPEPVEPQPGLFEEEGRKSTQTLPCELAQPKPEMPQPAALPAVVPSGGTPLEPAPGTAVPQDQAAKPGWWTRATDILATWAAQWLPWRKDRPFQVAPVQTELALDKVKVIRNDLSEDDLEVVAIDKKARKKTEKPVQSEPAEQEKTTAHP